MKKDNDQKEATPLTAVEMQRRVSSHLPTGEELENLANKYGSEVCLTVEGDEFRAQLQEMAAHNMKENMLWLKKQGY